MCCHLQIDSFREARYLAQLPALRELSLNDPHWGACPITQLCNYDTYMLCHLPHLTALDSLVLSQETKQAADAVFTKKRMYYNMRVKAMNRTVETARKVARAGIQKQLQSWYKESVPAAKIACSLAKLLNSTSHEVRILIHVGDSVCKITNSSVA